MGVTWAGISFDGPFSITVWIPPHQAAIYTIMIKPDPKDAPKTFRVLYFGESGNLSERGFYRLHHKYDCWIRISGSVNNLYIAIHNMPNSTKEERKAEEARLVDQYKPLCNF